MTRGFLPAKDQAPSPQPEIEYAPGPRGSTWPVTFGVLAIVFGVFGLIGSGWRMATIGIQTAMFETMGSIDIPPPPTTTTSPGAPPVPEVDPGEIFKSIAESVKRWVWAGITMQGLLFLLAILLLTGGIILLNRKAVSAKLLTIWAYGKIVIGIGAAYIGYQMQSGQMKAMMSGMDAAASGSGGAPPASFSNMFSMMAGIIFFFGVIWLSVLPVIFLIWLNRPAVKADLATWPR